MPVVAMKDPALPMTVRDGVLPGCLMAGITISVPCPFIPAATPRPDQPMEAPVGRERDLEPGGKVFAGSPDEVADCILHELLGHAERILQMDGGGLPHATFLRAIELLGARVPPRIRREIGRHAT